MTRHTLYGRIALLAVGCFVVGLALVPAGAGATGTVQTANDSTLAVSDAAVEPNADSRVRVSLDEAPAGLAGYEVTLELRTEGVATVTGASYPAHYQPTTDPDVDDGRTVTLEAADLSGQVEPGATNVTLATVNVSGVESGATRLVVTEIQVDGDDGSRVDPSLDPGAVTVGDADPPAPTTAAESGAADPTAAAGGATQNDASAADAQAQPAADTGPATATPRGGGSGLGVSTTLLGLVALLALTALVLFLRQR
jgi:hypothetical protein